MISIREIEEQDIIRLAECLPRLGQFYSCTTKETWLKWFETWWTLNPAFTSMTPKGWILENESTPVGFIGNVPVKFLIYGKVRTASAAVNWFVDPSVRGISSINLFNKYLSQKNVSLFLFNTGFEKTQKIIKKFKFKEFILPKYQKEYVYIFDKKRMRIILLKFLFNNGFPKLSKLLEYYKGVGLVFFAYLYQKPHIRFDDLQTNEYCTSLCNFCDDSFSKIWEPYLNSCNATLSRDTETLNWIYFSSIEPNKRVVIQCRRSHDNSLAGYMVFDLIWDKKSNKIGIMQLKDLIIENDDLTVQRLLLSYAIDVGEQNKAALLVLWANNHETDSYLRRTFWLRKSAQYHRYIRFSDTIEINSESLNVCLSVIDPPHGINHIQ